MKPRTKKKFKELAEASVKKYLAKRKKQEIFTTKAEKRKFILKHGWNHYETHPFGKGTFIDFWKKQPDKTGYPLHCAFKMALDEDDKKIRQQQRQSYKTKILCNKCGKDCAKKAGKHHAGYYGMIETEVTGGYESTDLSDTLRYRFSLCESCVLKMFLTFKNMPVVESYF